MALCSNAVMQLCVMQCKAHLMLCIRPCLAYKSCVYVPIAGMAQSLVPSRPVPGRDGTGRDFQMHTGFSKKFSKNFHKFFKKIELSKVKAIFLARLIKSLTKHPNFSTFSRFCNIVWVMPATFLLYPWHNVESRPVPFIPRDGTGRDGIGTGFSKWDGIVPTLPVRHTF